MQPQLLVLQTRRHGLLDTSRKTSRLRINHSYINSPLYQIAQGNKLTRQQKKTSVESSLSQLSRSYTIDSRSIAYNDNVPAPILKGPQTVLLTTIDG